MQIADEFVKRNFRVRHDLSADSPRAVCGTMRYWYGIEQLGRKISLSIDHAEAFTSFSILNDQNVQERGFTRARLAAEIEMVSSIGA